MGVYSPGLPPERFGCPLVTGTLDRTLRTFSVDVKVHYKHFIFDFNKYVRFIITVGFQNSIDVSLL